MRFLYEWSKNAQFAILAPRCPICRAAIGQETGLCEGCLGDIPSIDVACHYCALPLAATADTRVCPDCQRRPVFDRAIAACHYRQPIAWLIGGLKYGGHLSYAPVLGDVLADQLDDRLAEPPDRLVPVPLHKAAFRRRGFNQAERIAQRLNRRFDWPLTLDSFERRRDTPQQRTLDAKARAANVRDAFFARRDLTGQRIAIVDDVMTTTRTARAMTHAARAAGAREVHIYCVARA